MRRYTSVRITTYSLLLQAVISLAVFIDFALTYRSHLSVVLSTYGANQLGQFAIVVGSSLVQLTAGIAFLRGRSLYAIVIAAAFLKWLKFASWPLALTTAPIAVATVAVLFSPSGTGFLSRPRDNATGARHWVIGIALSISVACLHLTHMFSLISTRLDRKVHPRTTSGGSDDPGKHRIFCGCHALREGAARVGLWHGAHGLRDCHRDSHAWIFGVDASIRKIRRTILSRFRVSLDSGSGRTCDNPFHSGRPTAEDASSATAW
jgi:hypothetical protein